MNHIPVFGEKNEEKNSKVEKDEYIKSSVQM